MREQQQNNDTLMIWRLSLQKMWFLWAMEGLRRQNTHLRLFRYGRRCGIPILSITLLSWFLHLEFVEYYRRPLWTVFLAYNCSFWDFMNGLAITIIYEKNDLSVFAVWITAWITGMHIKSTTYVEDILIWHILSLL